MDKNLVEKILFQNKKNYDLIAEDFDKTRVFLWSEIEATACYITPKTAVLDVGCGNGRLFPFITKNQGKYLGFDISEKLIKIAQSKYGKKYFFVADLLNPSSYVFRVTCYDVIYCLAVLHHIPSFKLRLQALKNIKSLLKPNGILILSVWNLWQKKYLKYIIRETILKLIGKSQLNWRDCYIPYKIPNPKSQIPNPNLKSKNLINRYLHAFTLNELIHLIKKAGFEIKEAKKTKWNYLVVAKSTSSLFPNLNQ